MTITYPATAERRLLEYLWQHPGWHTPAEVLAGVTGGDYRPAYTTLHTTLSRMRDKQWVTSAHGRWRAAVTRQQLADALRNHILEVQ